MGIFDIIKRKQSDKPSDCTPGSQARTCTTCGRKLRVSGLGGGKMAAATVYDSSDPDAMAKAMEDFMTPARYICPSCLKAYCWKCCEAPGDSHNAYCPECHERIRLG